MSHAARLLRGGSLSAAGMGIGLLGSVAAGKLLATAPGLDVAALGAYATLVIAGDILLVLLGLGLRAALPKLLGEVPEPARAPLLAALFGAQLRLTGIGAALLLALALLLPASLLAHNDALARLAPVLWAVPLYALAAGTREFLLAAHAGLHTYGRRALGLAVYALAQAGAIFVLVWLQGGGLHAAAVAVVAAHTLGALALWILLPAGRRPTGDTTPFARAARFAWPLYANNVFNLLYQRADTFVVALMLGPGPAGLYEFGGKRLPAYAVGLLTAGVTPYLPSVSEFIARGERERAARLLGVVYWGAACAGFGGLFAATAVYPLLVHALLDADYLLDPRLFALLMAASVLHLLASLFGQTLIALDRPGQVAGINVGTALLTLGLVAGLGPVLGLWGAAIAALTGALFSQTLQALAVRRAGVAWHPAAILLPQLAGAVAMLALLMYPGLGGIAAAAALFAVLSAAALLLDPALRQQAARIARRLR